MANFKRGRAKNRRAGCLMCKPHKANGHKKRGQVTDTSRTGRQEYLGWLDETEQVREEKARSVDG